MSASRRKLPVETETEVLVRGRRRCALCFGLDGDFTEKIGQIAHIDKDRSNDSLNNLVWLCFEHHSLYDSTTSQHKNYQASEIRHYREKLYAAISTSAISGPESMGRYVATEENSTVICLPGRFIVLFGWPLRCKPTIYFHPATLAITGGIQIEEVTERSFQVVIHGTADRKSFAFFADASPTEYKQEAEIQREEWRSMRVPN